MEIHDNFTKWAIEQSVKINGVAAHRFPGKGIGIVAQKRLEAGEIVITVPVRALRTIRTVPRNISKSIGKITVHGLLAADLTADTTSTRAAWRAVLPTKTDFEESMPLMWPEQLQTLLPAIAIKLLLNQKRKFNDDWSAVSLAFPETSKEDYLYNWLIVNTRTFYYLPSTTKKPPPRDDCMALNPFADYFNHVHDSGLEVEFSDKGYTISTNVAIEKGEELNISYGNHSNSFLLAEYGFILKENKWDEMSLDAHILPRLSTKQRDLLREVNFFGNYVLDKENVCHRTQVALRLLCVPLRTWRQYVEGRQDGQKEQVTVDLMLLEVLESNKQEALLTLERISMAKEGHDCQRRTLSTHWKQILQLLEAAIAKIKKVEV